MASFDPYHQWLGIPPHEQPANFYRLLGVVMFESNPDIIAQAADRRMFHLGTYQAGQYADACQYISNEMAMARACLLDPEQKAAYDQQLQESLAHRSERAVNAAPPPPSFQQGPAAFQQGPAAFQQGPPGYQQGPSGPGFMPPPGMAAPQMMGGDPMAGFPNARRTEGPMAQFNLPPPSMPAPQGGFNGQGPTAAPFPAPMPLPQMPTYAPGPMPGGPGMPGPQGMPHGMPGPQGLNGPQGMPMQGPMPVDNRYGMPKPMQGAFPAPTIAYTGSPLPTRQPAAAPRPAASNAAPATAPKKPVAPAVTHESPPAPPETTELFVPSTTRRRYARKKKKSYSQELLVGGIVLGIGALLLIIYLVANSVDPDKHGWNSLTPDNQQTYVAPKPAVDKEKEKRDKEKADRDARVNAILDAERAAQSDAAKRANLHDAKPALPGGNQTFGNRVFNDNPVRSTNVIHERAEGSDDPVRDAVGLPPPPDHKPAP